MVERLQAAGMPTLDISGIEAAQVWPCCLTQATTQLLERDVAV